MTLIGIRSTILDEPSMEEMAQREVEPKSKIEIKSEIMVGLIRLDKKQIWKKNMRDRD